MAEKEFYRLDLVIGTDGVEDAEKSVKAIDKMLEQTTRRAAALGKSKITPTVRLEDRISSPAKKIEGRMEKINKTVAKPEARLVDKVSGAANKVSSTLTSLARKPYHVLIYAKDMATSTIMKIKNVLTSPLTMLGVGGGVAGATTFGLNMVMEEQGIKSAFKVLLGGEDAAQKRVEELTAFAGQTPYKREEIYDASRILQVFTGNALSTGDELKRIGDIAAGTKQPFGDVALWVGRLYDSLKSGRPVGEMTSRLQEMGAINGEARAGIEALAESGQDISKIWPIVTQGFSKFDGLMEDMSGNLQNLLLGTKSFFTQNVFKRWGMGIESALSPALKKFRQWRSENKETIAILGQSVEDFGKKIGTYVIGGIEKVTAKFNELAKNPEFQNADFLGKVRIAWDEIIAKPFSEWWAADGQSMITDMSGKIGGALGGGLKGFIMGALGLFTSNDKLSDDGTFTAAGVTAGQAFFQSFVEAFDVGAIAEKLKDTIWDVGSNAITDPSGANLLKAGLLGTLLYKLGGDKLLKGGRKVWDWGKGWFGGGKGGPPSPPTGGSSMGKPPTSSTPSKPLVTSKGPYERGWNPRTQTPPKPATLPKWNMPGIPAAAKVLRFLSSVEFLIPSVAGGLISDNIRNSREQQQLEFIERYIDNPRMLEWGALPTSERYMSFARQSPTAQVGKEEFINGIAPDTAKISDVQINQIKKFLNDPADKVGGGNGFLSDAIKLFEERISQVANYLKLPKEEEKFADIVTLDTVKISEDQVSQMMSYLSDFKKEVTNDIKVNVTPGAVQINTPTQEIDYKKIAYEAGWQIADAVRLQHQNTK